MPAPGQESEADRKQAPGRQPDAEPQETPEDEPAGEDKKEPEAAPDSAPVPQTPPQEPAPPTDTPAAAEPESPPEPEPPPETEPDAVKAAEPPRPSDDAALSGTIAGDTAAAKEVRFYGPNNILKLHARAPVARDGTFRIALPPAGSYRVVVTGEPGAHLFTHPEFRMLVVGADGKGVSGIDFEVRGRL